MIERAIFEGLVKDVTANLYDSAALETHPLIFSVFRPPAGFNGSKAEYVRALVTEAIQQLRPERSERGDPRAGGEPRAGGDPLRGGERKDESAPEWRPYLILQRRYVEGMELRALAASLAVSDRQMRRDHHRALQALTAVLWERLFGGESERSEEAPQPFETHAERVDLRETLTGLERMLRARLEEQGISAILELPPAPLEVTADRVVLRQVLIALMTDGLHHLSGERIHVRLRGEGAQAVVEVDFAVGEHWSAGESLSAVARYWGDALPGQLEEIPAAVGGQRVARRTLRLARGLGRSVLVVDDQSAAISLYRRLLAPAQVSVVGSDQPLEAVALAGQVQPALVILDVMMPRMDGWEVLQNLKLDERTRHIPVLVCSAWEEPELSRSLGAAGFLKKPVTQKALQEALKGLGLWE